MRFRYPVNAMLLATIGPLMAGSVCAQLTFPTKPIRFIVPFTPGGSTDAVARMIGLKMTDAWGVQTFVESRPGGNTVIGTEAIARAPADGYSILLTSNFFVITPNLLQKLPYDPVKDFVPVSTVCGLELVLVVHPSLPVKTVKDFIALAKAKPDQLNFASSGSGGAPHLAGESFKLMTDVKMQHIPYKGSGPAITDLIGGQVQLYFTVTANAVPMIKNGRVKAIAVTGEKRLPALPQMPTFTESGLPGFNMKTWFGILAPAGTPKPIVDKMSAELARIMALPDIKEKLSGQSMDPFVLNSEQFAALIKSELATFGNIIREAKIKADD